MHRLVPVLALICWLVSPPFPALAGDPSLATRKQAVIAQYAAIAQATYDDALAGARGLAAAIEAFLAAPSAESLQRARQAWIDARVPYLQSEAFRFYDGPIEAVEGLVNSWPIDENLIDYVDGEPDAGIVNQPRQFPVIDRALIASLNEKGGEKNITAGFHAIEFLLWGQDLNDEGPGERQFTDYVDGHGTNAERRRQYLRVASQLLVEDLERVVAEWAPDKPGNYRAHFVAMPPDEALAGILKGIGILSGAELAGERLTVAYETKEQEDEHSCFSDTTHLDIVHDVEGIENVWLGRYVRVGGEHVEGAGLRDLVAIVDPALARTLAQQVDAAVAAAAAVPAPFDRAVQGTDKAPGRIAVRRLIAALRAQSDSIARAGAALGLQLNF